MRSKHTSEWPRRWVRQWLRLAPPEFGDRFGNEIEEVFADQWHARTQVGRWLLAIGGAQDLLSVAFQLRSEQVVQALRGRVHRIGGKELDMSMKAPVNSMEALKSLVPGHLASELVEPSGWGRKRAYLQLGSYRKLRHLDWEGRWRAWSSSWARIAADPRVRFLRLGMLSGIATSAALGPLLLVATIDRLNSWWMALLIPLSPWATLAVIGIPWMLLFRAPLRRAVERHLPDVGQPAAVNMATQEGSVA